jgi:hypothetical protein
MGIFSALFGGSSSEEVRETSHVVEKDWPMLFLSLGTIDETYGHRVTKEDSDGCSGTGTGDTYEAASWNASHALERAHRNR